MIEARRKGPLAAAVAVAATLLGLAGGGGVALAGPPTGDFAVFAQCRTAVAERCIYGQSTKGELQLGRTTVPIVKAITLQGGAREVLGGEEFIEAENGETLSKTPQSVPGGLLAVVEHGLLAGKELKLYEEASEHSITGVTATVELMSDPGISLENWLEQSGVALSLPVRIELSNPFLGSGCYIGTNVSPVMLELTTGTTAPDLPNDPITGAPGEIEFKDGFELVLLDNYRLLDNAFALPKAEGCGLEPAIVDPAVNAALDLPSGDGHNAAALEGELQVATKGAVLASE